MTVHLVEGGDVFELGTAGVVIPTNAIGTQGAGLALAMAQRSPAWSSYYRSRCRAGGMSPGGVHVWIPPERRPVIFALVTKGDWREPSRLEWVEQGLHRLVEVVEGPGTVG